MLLAVFFLTVTAAANDYLPSTVGNDWTYQSDSTTTTVEITRSSSNWRSYTDFAGLGQAWIWTHNNHDAVYSWTPSQGTREFFDTSAPVGTRYSTDISNCGPETITVGISHGATHPGAH